MTTTLDINAPEFQGDLYGNYARLRAQGRVHKSELGRHSRRADGEVDRPSDPFLVALRAICRSGGHPSRRSWVLLVSQSPEAVVAFTD